MPTVGNISTITLPNGNTYTIGTQNASSLDIIADEFPNQAPYSIGDYCTYDGKVYRCTTATSSTSWNSSNWTQTTVMDEIIARCAILPAAGVSF